MDVSEEMRLKLTGHASKYMHQGYIHLQAATLKKIVRHYHC
jgi:hypothetical protein